MSDILIKGMEMPFEHPVLFCIHPDGKVFADMEGSWREYKAAPVPPHGRCIDADALEYEEAYLNGHYELGDFEIVTREDIESAPTIIPAEEDK